MDGSHPQTFSADLITSMPELGVYNVPRDFLGSRMFLIIACDGTFLEKNLNILTFEFAFLNTCH